MDGWRDKPTDGQTWSRNGEEGSDDYLNKKLSNVWHVYRRCKRCEADGAKQNKTKQNKNMKRIPSSSLGDGAGAGVGGESEQGNGNRDIRGEGSAWTCSFSQQDQTAAGTDLTTPHTTPLPHQHRHNRQRYVFTTIATLQRTRLGSPQRDREEESGGRMGAGKPAATTLRSTLCEDIAA